MFFMHYAKLNTVNGEVVALFRTPADVKWEVRNWPFFLKRLG
jgi:hypothetical protein